ncbi:hypothetical protein BpHYR1_051202 [Brachionus plicatilis]|uniref:Uncharacterized protein n=1 Tax=Brachionus plicatilis TaxID=10195 RepID=A0A3M7S4U8_BRAPC|nr:hypothetical protein BpHYR1_051202 [Brachionus plicatilis]
MIEISFLAKTKTMIILEHDHLNLIKILNLPMAIDCLKRQCCESTRPRLTFFSTNRLQFSENRLVKVHIKRSNRHTSNSGLKIVLRLVSRTCFEI